MTISKNLLKNLFKNSNSFVTVSRNVEGHIDTVRYFFKNNEKWLTFSNTFKNNSDHSGYVRRSTNDICFSVELLINEDIVIIMNRSGDIYVRESGYELSELDEDRVMRFVKSVRLTELSKLQYSKKSKDYITSFFK